MLSAVTRACILLAALLVGSVSAWGSQRLPAIESCNMTEIDSFTSYRVTSISHKVGDIVHEPELCLPQPEGDYTFAVFMDGQGGYDHVLPIVETTMIMDGDCKILGMFAKGCFQNKYSKLGSSRANIFGNYLKGVIIVTDMANVDDTPRSFTFWYLGHKYQITHNHCVCNEIPGHTEVAGCRCAFMVDGSPSPTSKRSLEFRA